MWQFPRKNVNSMSRLIRLGSFPQKNGQLRGSAQHSAGHGKLIPTDDRYLIWCHSEGSEDWEQDVALLSAGKTFLKLQLHFSTRAISASKRTEKSTSWLQWSLSFSQLKQFGNKSYKNTTISSPEACYCNLVVTDLAFSSRQFTHECHKQPSSDILDLHTDYTTDRPLHISRLKWTLAFQGV